MSNRMAIGVVIGAILLLVYAATGLPALALAGCVVWLTSAVVAP